MWGHYSCIQVIYCTHIFQRANGSTLIARIIMKSAHFTSQVDLSCRVRVQTKSLQITMSKLNQYPDVLFLSLWPRKIEVNKWSDLSESHHITQRAGTHWGRPYLRQHKSPFNCPRWRENMAHLSSFFHSRWAGTLTDVYMNGDETVYRKYISHTNWSGLIEWRNPTPPTRKYGEAVKAKTVSDSHCFFLHSAISGPRTDSRVKILQGS